MTEFLIALAVILALTVLPVMLAARIVKAGKTGFGAALLAVFLQLVLGALILKFVDNPTLALVISVVGGAAVFTVALDTTMLKGFAVSLLVAAIAIVVMYIFAGSFFFFGGATK